MKKIILTSLLCLPIIVVAQSITTEKESRSNKIATKTSSIHISKDRFKSEIPYIDTSNLKTISFDKIVENVNSDQIKLPIAERVFLDTNLKLVKLPTGYRCGTTFKIDPVLLKKH